MDDIATEAADGKPEALRLKGLMERLAAKMPGKRKDLRETVEAVLAELGQALEAGQDVMLPGLGHVKVVRRAENGALSLKLRKVARVGQKKAAEGDKESLAEVQEAD